MATVDESSEYVLRDSAAFLNLLAIRSLTQAELARNVRVSKQFVNLLVHGRRRAHPFTAWRIANTLGVDMGELFMPGQACRRRSA